MQKGFKLTKLKLGKLPAVDLGPIIAVLTAVILEDDTADTEGLDDHDIGKLRIKIEGLANCNIIIVTDKIAVQIVDGDDSCVVAR